MNSKHIFLFAALLFVLAACSSHGQHGGLVPETALQSRSLSTSAATSCAIAPNTMGTLEGTVGGVSATDAWDITAISFQFQHFNGSAWQSVPPPDLPIAFAFIALRGLVPIASNDVWTSALGTDRFGGHRTTFFLHWNGTQWTYVPNAPALTHDFQIEDIAGDASTNVWALVQSTASPPLHGPTGQGPTIELERWNGMQWVLVASQRSSSDIIGGASALTVVGPNDVWMMLRTTNSTFTSHWNGTSLSTSALPRLNGNNPDGEFIAGTADNDIWVSGFAGNVQPYIAHRSSSFGLYDTSLVTRYVAETILDFRPGYVLMLALDPTDTPALLIYNGFVRWRPTTAPWPAGTSGLGTASIVKGTTSFWAAFNTGLTSGGVALFQCPSTPPAPI